MSADKVTYAYFEVRGCKAEFYLNGIPCVRLDASDISVQSQSVQELLVPGANELEILIEPGDHPSAARSHARNANVKDMFARAAVTDIPPDLPTQPEYGTVLADVEFKLRPSEPEERSVPISVGGSFTLTRMTARWAWQDSPAMVLDEALKLEAREVLARLEEAFRSQSVDRYFDLAEAALKDGLKAYPAWDDAHLRDEIGKIMQWHKDQGGEFAPWSEEDEDFRLVAGDRLLHCVRKDWSALLKLRGKEGDVPYPVLLGRVGGKLGVVRF